MLNLDRDFESKSLKEEAEESRKFSKSYPPIAECAATALLIFGFFGIVYNSRDANGLRGFSYRTCFFNPALGERPQGVETGEREKERGACAKKTA